MCSGSRVAGRVFSSIEADCRSARGRLGPLQREIDGGAAAADPHRCGRLLDFRPFGRLHAPAGGQLKQGFDGQMSLQADLYAAVVLHGPAGDVGIGLDQTRDSRGQGLTRGLATQHGLSSRRVQITLLFMLVPADDVLAVGQCGRGGGDGLGPLAHFCPAAQTPATGQQPGHRRLPPVVHAAEVLVAVNRMQRLFEHPLIDRMQTFRPCRLGHDVGVVIQVDGLDATRRVGHLIALDHALEAEIRPLPVVRKNLLVRLRGIDLKILALGNAHGPDIRQRGPGLADGGAAAVDIAKPGFIGHGHGLIGRIAVAWPENHVAFLAGRAELVVDVLRSVDHIALGAEGVVGQRQVIAVREVFGFFAAAVGLARCNPVEWMRPGVAADFHPRQGVHALGPFLRLVGQFGIQTFVADFADDHRGQGGHLVFFEEFGHQHFAGQRRAGLVTGVRPTVAVEVHEKRPSPGAGGDVGHGVCAHAQSRAEKLDRLDRPARAGVAR